MKKWKIIKYITLIILVIFLIYVFYVGVISYKNYTDPHPMLGIDSNSWLDDFKMNLFFTLIICGIPILADIILLIISIIKARNNK